MNVPPLEYPSFPLLSNLEVTDVHTDSSKTEYPLKSVRRKKKGSKTLADAREDKRRPKEKADGKGGKNSGKDSKKGHGESNTSLNQKKSTSFMFETDSESGSEVGNMKIVVKLPKDKHPRKSELSDGKKEGQTAQQPKKELPHDTVDTTFRIHYTLESDEEVEEIEISTLGTKSGQSMNSQKKGDDKQASKNETRQRPPSAGSSISDDLNGRDQKFEIEKESTEEDEAEVIQAEKQHPKKEQKNGDEEQETMNQSVPDIGSSISQEVESEKEDESQRQQKAPRKKSDVKARDNRKPAPKGR
jgi:hypothetical protein